MNYVDICIWISVVYDLGFCGCMKDYLREHKELFFEKKRPKYPVMLEKGPVLPQILKKDVLLHYPYESIEPFLDMLKEASEDENVISIQMTLYRLAKNSKVIEALEMDPLLIPPLYLSGVSQPLKCRELEAKAPKVVREVIGKRSER